MFLFYGREKGRRRRLCLGKPLGVTPTAVDEDFTVFVSEIYDKTRSQKRAKDDTACPQLATSMYAALTLVKINKN